MVNILQIGYKILKKTAIIHKIKVKKINKEVNAEHSFYNLCSVCNKLKKSEI